MDMKRLSWGIIMIAATALLAGCGGGGGGGTSLTVDGSASDAGRYHCIRSPGGHHAGNGPGVAG